MPDTIEQIVERAVAAEERTRRLSGRAFPVIRVRYAGPTNHRGSRYIATLGDFRVTWHYAYELSGPENAIRAAYACWLRYRNDRIGSLGFDDSPRVFIPGDYDATTYAYTVVPEAMLA